MLQESAFNHMILYLLKIGKIYHDVIILIKAVVNKNKNEYYYNIFLEKVLNRNKSNRE